MSPSSWTAMAVGPVAGCCRASRVIAVQRELTIESANPELGEVIVDGGWSGGGATDGHGAFRIGDAGRPASLSLAGIAVRNCNGSCLAVASWLDMTVPHAVPLLPFCNCAPAGRGGAQGSARPGW